MAGLLNTEKMNLTATTKSTKEAIRVKSISIWIERKCTHLVNTETLEALLTKTKETGRLQIYNLPEHQIHGDIDAFKAPPPLYQRPRGGNSTFY